VPILGVVTTMTQPALCLSESDPADRYRPDFIAWAKAQPRGAGSDRAPVGHALRAGAHSLSGRARGPRHLTTTAAASRILELGRQQSGREEDRNAYAITSYNMQKDT
jgi:hypothetical protein